MKAQKYLDVSDLTLIGVVEHRAGVAVHTLNCFSSTHPSQPPSALPFTHPYFTSQIIQLLFRRHPQFNSVINI